MTWKAFGTLVLYCFFWIPGLLANIVFYNEARAIRRSTGRAPEGMGCLAALFWMNIIAIGFWVVVALALFGYFAGTHGVR